MISGFLCDVDENGACLGYYLASSGNLTTTHCVISEKSAVLDLIRESKHWPEIPHSVVSRLREIMVQFPVWMGRFFCFTLLFGWYQGSFTRDTVSQADHSPPASVKVKSGSQTHFI